MQNSEKDTRKLSIKDASTAGATTDTVEDAKRELKEKRTDSKYFKKWIGDSKVVDEDGKPLVVYYGTDEDFTMFDRSKGRANMDIQGSFFSPWDIDATGYAKNVRQFYLGAYIVSILMLGFSVLSSFVIRFITC